jgi:hypothetical protein
MGCPHHKRLPDLERFDNLMPIAPPASPRMLSSNHEGGCGSLCPKTRPGDSRQPDDNGPWRYPECQDRGKGACANSAISLNAGTGHPHFISMISMDSGRCAVARHRDQVNTSPPFASIACPVTEAERSDAKKTIEPATSSSLGTRPIAIGPSISAKTTSRGTPRASEAICR